MKFTKKLFFLLILITTNIVIESLKTTKMSKKSIERFRIIENEYARGAKRTKENNKIN